MNEQLYSILEITQYRWTYEIPYLADPISNAALVNTSPQVCLHIDRLAYKAGGNKIFPPASGELCDLRASGRLLKRGEGEELNRWMAGLDAKYRVEEMSKRKDLLKVCSELTSMRRD